MVNLYALITFLVQITSLSEEVGKLQREVASLQVKHQKDQLSIAQESSSIIISS